MDYEQWIVSIFQQHSLFLNNVAKKTERHSGRKDISKPFVFFSYFHVKYDKIFFQLFPDYLLGF